ncbi:hypothetical protein [uncultured Microbacterium sp.]|uniref:hypothetical protein n=1 Tax=uncultured Microbacterium sp. TaxID=191216 RepID=UPI002635B45E|nr:hypothetical protein [uncultured Microbacterium sp.]
MTAPDTLPISIRPLPLVHEHAWITESAHRTSDGVIVYVRCADCGTRRVDFRPIGGMPPMPQSQEITGCRGTRRHR